MELRRISAPANGQAGGLPPGLQPHAAIPPAAEPAGTPAPASATTGPTIPGSVTLQIAPPAVTPKVGGTFQVAVNLNGELLASQNIGPIRLMEIVGGGTIVIAVVLAAVNARTLSSFWSAGQQT